MIQTIKTQIRNIDQSIEWIAKNRPEDLKQKFMLLIDERRKLRKIEHASEEKPAIAAFGESQKGKSYLMGNLLQNNGLSFMVKTEAGEEIDFVQRINPIGDKKEATGVVTRFTTFLENADNKRYNELHPVIIKLLSPSSVATILCDSYHKDVMDYQTYSDDEIKDFSESIFNKYHNMPDTGLDVIREDDILEIKSYLSKFLIETQGLRRSKFFENLALVIRKIPIGEWTNVFGYLWHQNPIISQLFDRIINVLHKLNFANELYTDTDTVLHHGDNMNTIMSVDCLNGLDNKDWDRNATVYRKDDNGIFHAIDNIPKCELAAVCAETIYKVDSKYVKDEVEYQVYSGSDYHYGDLGDDVKLENKAIRKELLDNSDLLDFPGARNRLAVKEEFIANTDIVTGTSNTVQMLLRGKVAYLFNSYSDSRIVNILLFCHDAEAIVVNQMYIMINDWVERYVGKTPEQRKEMIAKCGNVPPLFNICTKFNIDMIENENVEKNNDAALNQRWSGRLLKVLYTQAFKANDVDWFRNWTGNDCSFKNSYLLRDFKYSGCTGSGNNLWEGYKETEIGSKEEKPRISEAFYKRMRDTFISNKDVEMFFDNPSLAWDLAATRNNDGALYIIEKLNVVAKHSAAAREKLFSTELSTVMNSIYNIMEGYYVSTNVEDILEGNIRKAKAIFREMDFTCNSDNYYFGHLIQALQLTETQSYREVHKIMQSPELNNTVNSFQEYEIIRNSCRKAGYPIEEIKEDAEKWEYIIKTYGFSNKEEAESFLEKKNIDIQKLFTGSYRRKLNSCIIADSVFDKWCSSIKSVDFLNEFSNDDSFDTTIMSNLVDELITTANSFNVRDRLADSIAEYVNVVAIHTANENLLADMLASIINNFVLDFGFSWLTDDEKAKAKNTCEKFNIPAFNYITKEIPATFDETALTAMFNEMSSSPKALLPSFEDNYNKWLEYMFVSFVAHLDMPDIDPEANNMIKMLLESIKSAA